MSTNKNIDADKPVDFFYVFNLLLSRKISISVITILFTFSGFFYNLYSNEQFFRSSAVFELGFFQASPNKYMSIEDSQAFIQYIDSEYIKLPSYNKNDTNVNEIFEIAKNNGKSYMFISTDSTSKDSAINNIHKILENVAKRHHDTKAHLIDEERNSYNFLEKSSTGISKNITLMNEHHDVIRDKKRNLEKLLIKLDSSKIQDLSNSHEASMRISVDMEKRYLIESIAGVEIESNRINSKIAELENDLYQISQKKYNVEEKLNYLSKYDGTKIYGEIDVTELESHNLVINLFSFFLLGLTLSILSILARHFFLMPLKNSKV